LRVLRSSYAAAACTVGAAGAGSAAALQAGLPVRSLRNEVSSVNDDNGQSVFSTSKNNSRISGYSIASFILAVVPVVILLAGFLFCLVVSGGNLSDNDSGAVWWIFIAMLIVMVPVTGIANILSVIFGIIGLKKKKTVIAWVGIAVVAIELVAVPLIYIFLV